MKLKVSTAPAAATVGREVTLDDTVAGSARLSVRRLNVMRLGYLEMGLGLAVTKWPSLFSRQGHWPLYEGVTT